MGTPAVPPDFLTVRVGLGDETRFPLTVPPEQDPVHPYDPILLGEAVATAGQCAVVRGIPITVRLDGAGQVALIGDPADVLAAARSLLLQLATLHAPEDVALAAAFPEWAAEDWRGADLLPHLIDGAVRRARRPPPPSACCSGPTWPSAAAVRRAGAAGQARPVTRPGWSCSSTTGVGSRPPCRCRSRPSRCPICT